MSGVGIRQLKKAEGAAGEGNRGGPPLHIWLAGALCNQYAYVNCENNLVT